MASSRKSASDGPRRGLKYQPGPELWARVLERCQAEFAKRFGRRWDPGWVASEAPSAEQAAQAERRARKAFLDLRRSMAAVVDVVRWRGPGAPPPIYARGGECLAFLAWWAPTFLEPLLRQNALAVEPSWERLEGSERERVIKVWTSINLWDDDADTLIAPTRLSQGKPARMLAPRDLALVTLLHGCRPPTNPHGRYSAAEVVQIEEKVVRKLLDAGRGKFWRGPGGRNHHQADPVE